MVLALRVVLTGGKFGRKSGIFSQERRVVWFFSPEWKRNATERAVSGALEKVVKEAGARYVTAVAIAYVMQKALYVFDLHDC